MYIIISIYITMVRILQLALHSQIFRNVCSMSLVQTMYANMFKCMTTNTFNCSNPQVLVKVSILSKRNTYVHCISTNQYNH